MESKVYIETSFVSYLVSEPSANLVIAGRQQVTRDWWADHRESYDLYASELVIEEARAGDPKAAAKRLATLKAIPLIALTDSAVELAEALVQDGPIPEVAAADALHIAVAVTSGIEYLLTWNFRHLANAFLRRRVEAFCLSRGHEPCMICTPDELLEGEP